MNEENPTTQFADEPLNAVVETAAAESQADNVATDEPTESADTDQPVETRSSTVTLTADDLARLLDKAEQRGYERAAAAAGPAPEPAPVPETRVQTSSPGLYEEPEAFDRAPLRKSTPLLTRRRSSIWER